MHTGIFVRKTIRDNPGIVSYHFRYRNDWGDEIDRTRVSKKVFAHKTSVSYRSVIRRILLCP